MAEVGFLREEGASLAALLRELTPAQWQQPTPFKNWTPWDVVAHLHLSDLWACASLRSRDDFAVEIKPFLKAIQQRTPMRDYTRQCFEALDGPALHAAWQQTLATLCAAVDAAEANTRLAWFGPDMGLRSFVTARYMETWAHGQDLYDLLGRRRVYTDALHAIATLGVKTYEFCFRNRGQTAPQPLPYLHLVAPSGAIWEWNEPSAEHRIEGQASEFCHVVTQNRNVADTALRVIGASALQWMNIAQCFAGPPETPPAPGTRV